MRALDAMEGGLRPAIRNGCRLIPLLDRVEQAGARARYLGRGGDARLLGHGGRPDIQRNQAHGDAAPLLPPDLVGGEGRVRRQAEPAGLPRLLREGLRRALRQGGVLVHYQRADRVLRDGLHPGSVPPGKEGHPPDYEGDAEPDEGACDGLQEPEGQESGVQAGRREERDPVRPRKQVEPGGLAGRTHPRVAMERLVEEGRYHR